MKNIIIVSLLLVSSLMYSQDTQNTNKETSVSTKEINVKKFAKMEKVIAQQMKVLPKYIQLLKVNNGTVAKSDDQLKRENNADESMISQGNANLVSGYKTSYNKSTFVVFIFNDNRLCSGYYTKSKKPYSYSCVVLNKKYTKKESSE